VGSTTSTPAAAPGPGDFGSLKAVCGPGNAKGATDKGVTDTSIDIGTMADPGATVQPGLDQELFDAATTFAKWCNAAGGILGRQINLHLRDSALFNVGQQTLASCGQDFAQVGSGAAFDDAGVAPRVACGEPMFDGYLNTPKAISAALQIQASPAVSQQQTTALYRGFQHAYPGELKAGFLVGDLASVVVSEKRFKEAAQLTGFNVAYESTYPITGPANPENYVQQAKAAGVQMLMVVGAPEHVVAIEKGMQTVGWYPDAIVEVANVYDKILTKTGGSAIKNTWILSNFVPYEADPVQYPAVKQFTDLMAQYNPSGKIANLSLNAWNSWLLFATAAKACGSNLTRACLLQQGGSQTDWTGGGLLGGPVTTSPTNPQVPQCYLTLKASPTGFTIDPTFLVPNKGLFNCDPANVVTLKGNYSG
jgi:hypothetical protein